MSQYALPHRVFPFNPYANPHDFAMRASSTMLQHEMPILLNLAQERGDTLEKRQQSVHAGNLKQIRDLMQALEWLKNEGIHEENLSDVKLYYMTDHTGGFSWSIEGMVSAHTDHSRLFEIGFTDEWYDWIVIYVGGVCIKSYEVEEEEEA